MGQSLIGIFGGTFNPVHVGHVRAAIEVAEALGLAAVEFVPAARPPHKSGEPVLDFELRLALCRLAVEEVPGFSVNSMEADRPGPSYTCDTLAALGRERPGQEFCFVMGMADLCNLPAWKNGLGLGRLAHLAVHSRDGLGLDAFTAFVAANSREMEASPTGDPACWDLPAGRRLSFVPIARLDVSASDVRERWRHGRRIHGLVPDAVRRELENRDDAIAALWGRRIRT
ncbi:nicotinate (nicotinamide) nucleotide adenylyltransferase [Solidesulfovibrio sp.]|uniref:nicotinate (nicotinamide) nucleotide adenylyltransferase n=1 Tax=Solidesulfovibrio sp. TaxID=2910990 RepID=UPI00260722CC|nr:nicotinate (nicotinamide) nucleotide adenylyltransferase [Solidesulfovibrio sp.]